MNNKKILCENCLESVNYKVVDEELTRSLKGKNILFQVRLLIVLIVISLFMLKKLTNIINKLSMKLLGVRMVLSPMKI